MSDESPLADPLGIEGAMPPELAAQCLDFLDLVDILRVTAVNKRWRQLALEHPTFWRDLSLDLCEPFDPRHIRLFRLRLSRSRDRPVNISILYCPPSRGESGELDILGDIRAHLWHIQALNCTAYNEEMVDALLDALTHPAPILHTLRLYNHKTARNCEIPVGIFAGSAPSLRNAVFQCLDIPAPVPAGLREIANLTVNNSAVSDVFQGCPRLRELHLRGQVTLHPAFYERRSWDGIEILYIGQGEIGRTWYSLDLPVSTVPMVVVSLGYLHDSLEPPGTAETLSAFAALIEGRVVVHVRQTDPREIWIDVRGGTLQTDHLKRRVILWKQVRRFRFNESPPVPFPGSDLAAGFAHRIVILVVALDVWASALCLGSLPFLHTLALYIENGSTPESPGALACRRLRRVALRSESTRPIVVALAPFAQFARTALHEAQLPLVLEFRNVELLPGDAIDSEPTTFRKEAPPT